LPDQLSNPRADQYQPKTQISVPPSGGPHGLSHPVGPLPFTGLDLILLAVVALVSIGTGLALHFGTRQKFWQP